MTSATCVEIVRRFYAVTGRRLPEKANEADAVFSTWEEAIGDLPDDDVALAAAIEVIRTSDLRYGLPSPVAVREAYIEIQRRLPPSRLAIEEETNPVVATTAVNRAAVAAAMERLFRLPAREAAVEQPEPAGRRVKAGAHEFGDHQLCGSDCSERSERVTTSALQFGVEVPPDEAHADAHQD